MSSASRFTCLERTSKLSTTEVLDFLLKQSITAWQLCFIHVAHHPCPHLLCHHISQQRPHFSQWWSHLPLSLDHDSPLFITISSLKLQLVFLNPTTKLLQSIDYPEDPPDGVRERHWTGNPKLLLPLAQQSPSLWKEEKNHLTHPSCISKYRQTRKKQTQEPQFYCLLFSFLNPTCSR